ncbi:four-carbon acid sugar kinase family protein [Microbacterium sp. A8/3-1]|uniref:Four-carbon acid sugar kinase family protein n=1 Tax=Microbacterium sp. A8/3-1 TaxID=3160749 RepID=A0AAU7W232_9MICO
MADLSASTWAVVADDLTGAADAGARFADAGRAVRVHVSASTDSTLFLHPGTVQVLVTESRGLDPSAAANATADAAARLLESGVDRLYVKIDSVGRGPVAAQIDGALRAWNTRHSGARVLVCPAYPALGRTVRDGIIHVDGAVATASAAANDPVSPVTSSDLRALLERIVSVVVADAVDDDELQALARAVLDSPSVLPVGSAGLLGQIVNALPANAPADGSPAGPAGRIVVACSSLHPIALAQVAALESHGDSGVSIITAPEERMTAETAADAFGRTVTAAMAAEPAAALVLVGGDGALAALRHLGATHVDLDSSLIDGCATGIVGGGVCDGLRVVTKSGGFGGPRVLVDLVTLLRRNADSVIDLASESRRKKEES